MLAIVEPPDCLQCSGQLVRANGAFECMYCGLPSGGNLFLAERAGVEAADRATLPLAGPKIVAAATPQHADLEVEEPLPPPAPETLTEASIPEVVPAPAKAVQGKRKR